MKKRAYLIVILLVNIVFQAHAVLKEKDLNSTLVILRKELMDKHDELEKRNKYTQIRNERTMEQFRETFHRSNQNSLMLYSQKPDYVFDLTYACHEATDQFQQFTRHSAPLRGRRRRGPQQLRPLRVHHGCLCAAGYRGLCHLLC